MISSDEMIEFARESLGLSQAIDVELHSLEERGSDRTYFRIKWNRENSAILVHYDPSRSENANYADISRFLFGINIPVPEIIRHDPSACLIAMKDLGDTNLWSLRNVPWKIRKAFYVKTLRIVHRLHSFPLQRFPSGRVKLAAAFGVDLYRWEHGYFLENFVGMLCRIDLEQRLQQQIETELLELAQKLASDTHNLVHRDLQSQNVMICREEPYLIDFQGMRFGSLFYDLGSLLYDPYVRISERQRDALLSDYYRLSEQDREWDSFRKSFWEASAQRLMQALGAYSYLGRAKGLTKYLEHIPAGLGNLRIAARNAASLPSLLKLCGECEKACSNFQSSMEFLQTSR